MDLDHWNVKYGKTSNWRILNGDSTIPNCKGPAASSNALLYGWRVSNELHTFNDGPLITWCTAGKENLSKYPACHSSLGTAISSVQDCHQRVKRYMNRDKIINFNLITNNINNMWYIQHTKLKWRSVLQPYYSISSKFNNLNFQITHDQHMKRQTPLAQTSY
jgi:hypothetical protein